MRRARAARRDPWTALGMQWLEMMSASSLVIARRTRRRNNPAQLFQMGNEKAQAGIEAWHAMLRHSLAPAPRAMGPADAWAHLLAVAITPFHARAVSNARRRGW